MRVDLPAASCPGDDARGRADVVARADGFVAGAAAVAVLALLGALLWQALPPRGVVIVASLVVLIAATVWLVFRLNAARLCDAP